ncbi:MAG TPA: precorrin-3B synthase [Xanthobacteraceae bacterium]|nr:precorrin-3B synthase [Xanthobacteraceae bacterium]
MTAARTNLRRGACPGLSTPMQTGDGLLARLTPIGTVSLDAMEGLTAAARRYGNCIVEITSRGSIQVRGLTAQSAPSFADAVAALGIAADDGVPIITDPLAGLDRDELIDAGALAAALRGALAAAPLAKLNPKVSVVIDGGGALHLDALPADIRLRAIAAPDGPRIHIAVGGDAASAAPFRTVAPADVVDTVVRLLGEIAAHGPEARARDAMRRASADTDAPAREPADPVGLHRLRRNRLAVGVGLPFGHTDTGALNSLLRAARVVEASGVRTAPGRALLVVGLRRLEAEQIAATARRLDFIVEPRDPRRRLIACAGAPICASGEIEARSLAREVARHAMPLMRRDETIHISGCAKSCAYQGVATFTATGRGGVCDLLVEGAPAGSCESWQLAERLGKIAVDRISKSKS